MHIAYSKQSIYSSLTRLWLNGTINIYYLLRTSLLFLSWWVDVYPRKLWWIFYYCSVISYEGKAIRLTPGVGFLLAPGPKRTKGVVFFYPRGKGVVQGRVVGSSSPRRVGFWVSRCALTPKSLISYIIYLLDPNLYLTYWIFCQRIKCDRFTSNLSPTLSLFFHLLYKKHILNFGGHNKGGLGGDEVSCGV